eukprot:COSAG06_NODE_4612_length_4101_cov_2.753373_1_plen_300_part_00
MGACFGSEAAGDDNEAGAASTENPAMPMGQPAVGTATVALEDVTLGEIEELEVLLSICAWINSPRDLGRLACASSCFGRPIAWPSAGVGSERLSVVDESARRRVLARGLEGAGAGGPGEARSWLRRMHEVRCVRFVEAHEKVALSEDGAVATMTVGGIDRNAAGPVLAGGRHYAVWTLEKIKNEGTGAGEGYPSIGVVAEGFDVLGPPAYDQAGNCFMSTMNGAREPGLSDWPGMPGSLKHGDRIGLLLDTTEGSLSVFLNDVSLGVMIESGLTGRYRWAVSLDVENDSVRIEPAPVPT